MNVLLITWRYMSANQLKTIILTVCLTITIFLPFALHQLIGFYERDMLARADATPLVIGAKGDRYDLVLKTLYFNGDSPESLTQADLDTVSAQLDGTAIPLHLEFTAREKPIVGAGFEYFAFRRLTPAQGQFPQRLGDCVIGSRAAANLNLTTGDTIISDQTSLYNIAASYPLQMHVTGILAESGSADDDAIFTDIRTTWIIAGIGHGHNDLAEKESESFVKSREGDTITANAAIFEYTEITDANIDSFHFHAAPESLPLTAILCLPATPKASTLLKGRINVSERLQLLVPSESVRELLDVVFRVKRFFNGSFLLVLIATTLFLTLVILLSLRLRARERQTMFRIGCSPGMIFKMHALELALILIASAILAAALSQLLLTNAPALLKLLNA
jgi:putative ABC transport system permease protein